MSMKVSPIKRREPLRRKQLTAKMPVHFDVEEKRGKKIIVSKVPRKSPDKTNSNIKTLQSENVELKKEIEELRQMYKLRNDDAKDYSKILTQKENEIKELKKKRDDMKRKFDEWLNTYCTHGGKDNCVECIEELKQKLFGAGGSK